MTISGVTCVDYNPVETGRLRDRGSILCHAFDMKQQRFGTHPTGILQCAAGGDAPGEVRELNSKIAVSLFAQQSNIGSYRRFLPASSV